MSHQLEFSTLVKMVGHGRNIGCGNCPVSEELYLKLSYTWQEENGIISIVIVYVL